MHPKDADRIANSVDPDQTAPLGAVRSGSALFAQTCLSKNLGKITVTVDFDLFFAGVATATVLQLTSWLLVEK